MKRTLAITGIILLNLGLIAIALLLYMDTRITIMRATDSPHDIERWFLIPIIFVGLLFFFMNRKFRLFGIGVCAVFISGLIFLVFFLNRSLASEGEYESFKLGDARWVDAKFYLDIGRHSIEVTQEKCLNVDSVQVRVDKGFFGMGMMTNDARIVENSNCEQDDIDSADIAKNHLDMAHKLAHKRCFREAIQHYSNCIELDTVSPDNYYHRGLMFMAIENYDKALIDFCTSALLRYQQLDPKTIDFIKNIDPAVYTKALFDKIGNKNYDGMETYIQNLSAIDDFDTYQKRIVFCLEKVEEE